jgi:NTE family protein
MRRAVLASSDQPVLMPPVRIPGRRTPIRQYVDGGVKEYAPLSAAIENGATEIYVIALSPEREPAQGKRYTNVLDIAGRTLDILVDDVGQNDLASGRFYADATCYVDAVKRRARTELGLSAAQVRRLFDVPGHANPFAGRPAVRLHVVRPTRGLPTDGLDFDPDVMQRMMRSGMARARAVLGR